MEGYFEKPGNNSACIPFLLKLTLLSGAIMYSVTTLAQLQLIDSIKNEKIPNQAAQKPPNLELYGFILTDVIYDFKQMDPKWYDVPRPTKLPAYKDQFAPGGQVYFSVRETRFGIKSSSSTQLGPLNTLFEFDM